MDKSGDLDAALSFVVSRITEQARISGEPLSNEQSLLLNYLPSTSIGWATEDSPVPRNINLERLCALTKAAYLNDREVNPASLNWEFAFGVFTLMRHPMRGVLHSAGVKIYKRPLWDQIVVIIAALFPLVAVMLLVSSGPQTLFRSAGILCGTVAIMLLIYLASRQIEQWQLENHIEKCRPACRNTSWKTS